MNPYSMYNNMMEKNCILHGFISSMMVMVGVAADIDEPVRLICGHEDGTVIMLSLGSAALSDGNITANDNQLKNPQIIQEFENTMISLADQLNSARAHASVVRVHKYKGHQERISCLTQIKCDSNDTSTSNDKIFLVSGSRDSTVRIWEISGRYREMACARALESPVVAISALTTEMHHKAQSLNSKGVTAYIAIGLEDKILYIWEFNGQTISLVRRCINHKESIRSITVSHIHALDDCNVRYSDNNVVGIAQLSSMRKHNHTDQEAHRPWYFISVDVNLMTVSDFTLKY
jgi:WD40 repeat protein